MLMRFDPFFEQDRPTGRGRRVDPLAADAYHKNGEVIIHIDIPGIEADDIDLTVEKSALTVTAVRRYAGDEADIMFSERPQGEFKRTFMLGDNLDTDRTNAKYDAGVLTIAIPVAQSAQPRRVEIRQGAAPRSVEPGTT